MTVTDLGKRQFRRDGPTQLWSFTERTRRARLLPSLAIVGDPCDNAMAEAFWGRSRPSYLTGNADGPDSNSRTRH
ncbi:transposase InsO family protein [Kibdelosporangium phytohabitans]|uniref:Uncharacterized protein n=1 Tax=Kibdelosporangium phytohabitans TaxID=860235 RepID=A0A0N9HY86_9PSEU|nr:hypothetical protein AOZ06_40400 [Kibdelosporangium phytohabitans]MBE1463848.1 transposase InsO family protein [Kibdelosporangium phytohabitans]